MSRGLLVSLLLILIVVLAVAQFLRTHEQHEVHVPVYPQAPAWQHRFLAATRLLEKFGVPAQEVASLERHGDPGAQRLLVLPAPRANVSSATAAHVHAAVEAGARLILESNPVDDTDTLVEAFGVKRAKPDFTACKSKTDNVYSPGWTERLGNSGLNTPPLVDVAELGEPTLKISLQGGESLSSDAQGGWEIAGCEGTRVLHRALGAGSVTVINDITPFTNWGIARDDNAEFFWRLVQLDGKPAEVLFVTLPESGLKDWLIVNAWRVMIAFAALVVLWLWSLAPREGPVRAEPLPVRRRLLDHLRANGRLLWSAGAREALGRAARDWALERVTHEHPHLRSASLAERVALLERRFRLPHAWAQLFGDGPPPADVAGFIALIRACRALHVQLRRHGTSHDPLYDLDE